MRLSAGGPSGTPGASGAPHPAGVQRRALREAARFERGRPRLASPPSPASTRNSWRCSSPRPWARSETSFFIRGIYLTGHFFYSGHLFDRPISSFRGFYLASPFVHLGHLFGQVVPSDLWSLHFVKWIFASLCFSTSGL